jgi:hypothetical protein
MMQAEKSIEIRAMAFSDHMAVIFHTECMHTSTMSGRGPWKMNTALLTSKDIRDALKTEWGKWSTTKTNHPTCVQWWCHCIKRKIKVFFCRMGSERQWDFRRMENFYHQAIYDLLHDHHDYSDKYLALKQIKAKLIKLNFARYKSMFLDTDKDRYSKEEHFLFHLLRTTKRRKQQTIHQIQTLERRFTQISQGILHAFHNHFVAAYAEIPKHTACTTALRSHITTRLQVAANMVFECPITTGELLYAITSGKKETSGRTESAMNSTKHFGAQLDQSHWK